MNSSDICSFKIPDYWVIKNQRLFLVIALLSDEGPQNITVGCWELGLNLSLPPQLFKHRAVIF